MCIYNMCLCLKKQKLFTLNNLVFQHLNNTDVVIISLENYFIPFYFILSVLPTLSIYRSITLHIAHF